MPRGACLMGSTTPRNPPEIRVFPPRCAFCSIRMTSAPSSEALMDAEVEAATDCGPVSHKAEKKDKEKAEQAETEALMDAEVEVATDCGCGCGRSKK